MSHASGAGCGGPASEREGEFEGRSPSIKDDEKTAKGQSEYNGQTYYFCATICKTKFDQDPAKYVKA